MKLYSSSNNSLKIVLPEHIHNAIKKEFPDYHETVATSWIWEPYAIKYAQNVIKGRWYEIEPYILRSDFEYSCRLYAQEVIKGRWPELESQLLQSCDYHNIFCYTVEIIKERWPEAEPLLIKENGFWAIAYTQEVIKGRWPELEQNITNNRLTNIINTYYRIFPDAQVYQEGTPVLINSVFITDISNKTNCKQLKQLIRLLRADDLKNASESSIDCFLKDLVSRRWIYEQHIINNINNNDIYYHKTTEQLKQLKFEDFCILMGAFLSTHTDFE